MPESKHTHLGPRLPQEILDIIISNLEGCPAALYRCAQVSSQLHPLSEKLLYRKFTLGPPIRYDSRSPSKTRPNLQSVQYLLRLLSAKPYLANYIEELIITNNGPLFTWLDRNATKWLCHTDTIGKVIFSLTNLRRLSLIGVVSLASDDNYLDWFEFSGAFRLTMFYALTKLESLEMVRLEHVDNVPLGLFDRLPSGMKELVLHGVAWAPDGYDPPERLFERFEGNLVEALVHPKRKKLRKKNSPSPPETGRKPCQLETLCLHLHDSCYLPLANYLLSSSIAPQLTNLRHLHCGMREPEDHEQIWHLVSKCQMSLEKLELFPAWPVSHESTMVDHLDFAALPNLRCLYFNFFIQADSWGADDWAPWVARAMKRISCPSIPSVNYPSTPALLTPSTSSSSTSSSSSSPATSLSLTSANDQQSYRKSNKIENIRIRLEFGFTEGDDLYVNLAAWRLVDDALGFKDDFPCLREFRVDVICVDEGTTPFLEGLIVEIKAQFPKLSKRGIFRILKGPRCSSECLDPNEHTPDFSGILSDTWL